MQAKSSVFGSGSEKELFKTIHTNWSNEFDIYPSLPFRMLIDLQNENLSQKESDFLDKTNIDYTLCTKNGKPILSIEFDGMGHGFSTEGEYIQVLQTKDKFRKVKLDLKLKIANQVVYPFFVVSYDEKGDIGQDMHLTIVDGIIGEVIAKMEFSKLINNFVAEEKESIGMMPKNEQYDYIQDLVFQAEVQADSKWNLLAKKCDEYNRILLTRKLYNGEKWHYLNDPPFSGLDINNLYNLTSQQIKEATDDIVKKTKRVGCNFILKTTKQDFAETIWVRNFGGFGVSPLNIALNIARLLAFKKSCEFYGEFLVNE